MSSTRKPGEATPSSTAPPAATATSLPPAETPTEEPRALTICLGSEPESLYLYSNAGLAMTGILAAIYDGPIDNRSFAYQPVILEKLPSLSDGDAALRPVTVMSGDRIVDADGEVVALQPGVRFFPSGCQSQNCALAWAGGSRWVGARGM